MRTATTPPPSHTTLDSKAPRVGSSSSFAPSIEGLAVSNPLCVLPGHSFFTPRETQRLQAKLRDPARRTNRASRRYLLTRLLRCSHCKGTLVARPRDDRSRRYVCASGPGFGGCGKTTVIADPVEQFIAHAVLHRLEAPRLSEARKRTPANAKGAEWQ